MAAGSKIAAGRKMRGLEPRSLGEESSMRLHHGPADGSEGRGGHAEGMRSRADLSRDRWTQSPAC